MSPTADEFEPKSGEILRLGRALYRLDTNELHCDDDQPLNLRGQSAEVLAYLARQAGQVVTKANLASAVWAETFVTDGSLVQCIGDIRRVLGDTDHQIVETFIKRGYRLNLTQVTADTPVVQEIPRVAVLAFEDHSTGANRGILSDAIAVGVTTELAHFGEFSVVSRASSFKFRTGDLGAAAIGAELGAQYVIEGSQQVAGGKLRVSVQLIEARTDTNIWSHSYDYDLNDDLMAQSEIVRIVAASAGFQVCGHAPTLVEPKYSGAMHDFLTSGVDVHHRTHEELQIAEAMNRKAIADDPKSPYGYIGMAFCEGGKYWHRWEPIRSFDGLVLAGEYADRALELAAPNSQAHFARGCVHKEAGEMDAAEVRLNRALAPNPHLVQARIILAFVAFYRGDPQDAAKQIERAMHTNPSHPDWFFACHAAALRQCSQYEKALAVFHNMSSVPGSNHMQLGAIYVGLGRRQEAEAAMQQFLKRSPHHTVSRERFFEERKFEKTDELNRWLGLIRKAGLPE